VVGIRRISEPVEQRVDPVWLWLAALRERLQRLVEGVFLGVGPISIGILFIESPMEGVGADVGAYAVQIVIITNDMVVETALPKGRTGRST